ncbi:MAG: TonB-dependent receptor [Sphingomonas fennica]
MLRFTGNTAIAAVLMTVAAGAAHAQEVTSTVRGTVTAGGVPVGGAEVVVLHVPSGTRATTTTGADGAFSSSGLRVGGPFTVTVTAPGYAPQSVTDLQLTAGQPFRLPIDLAPVGEEITITGQRTRAIEQSTGPITVLGREAIAGVASVTRDIRDIARRDPFATIDPNSRGVIIAGQNPRLNLFSVDGQRFSDNFGLNNGGLPTARGPVPLDAIEQFSVKTAPYDVTEGNFQGGSVNVVLRSGTNSFTGSAFYTYTGDKLAGDRTRGSATNPSGRINLNFKSDNYGAFLSGPIIKDKLFFAVAYEKLKETSPVQFGLAGFPNVVPGVTQAVLDEVGGIARSRYNYDTLGLLNFFTEEDEKYTVKLDWNVTDGQRLSATYIRNEGTLGQDPNFSTVAPASPALSLASNLYYRPETVDSATVQLNSDWADNFHSQIRANYREYDLLPQPLGALSIGQFQVCTDATNPATGAGNAPQTCSQNVGATPGAARLYFGPDQFRHANLVQTKSYGLDVVLRWQWREHSIKLQAAWNRQDARNVFVPNALGTFYFDSIADLRIGRASRLDLNGSTTGNLDDIEASFAYNQFNFGLQDSWDISDRLNVTYGVRADLFGMGVRPPLNTAFVQRYGFTNTYQFDGKLVAQPRFGLTWKATDQIEVRSGVGLFAGGSPDVFIGNSFSVPGVFNNGISIQRIPTGTGCNVAVALCAAALDNVTGANFPAAVTDFLRTNTASIATAAVNAMTGDFKPSSSWKASLSVDWKPEFDWAGRGWTLGGDLYGGLTQNAPVYRDIRIVANGTLPDGRPRYASLTPASPNNDLLLSNTKRGYSFIAIARIDKAFDFGLRTGASYTFQDVKDVTPFNGTTASGTYGQAAMVDPNRPAYGRSLYEIRNTLKFYVDFDHAFFGDYKTRFSLFGERRSGAPYSLTMNDPAFANSRSNVFGVTGTSNRFLLYVPNVSSIAADPRVSYDSAATFAAFQSYVQQAGLEQGQIVKKNSVRAPNFFKIDLHVDQEIPVPIVRTGRLKLFADMENVLNFIDRDWGSLQQIGVISAAAFAPVVNVSCLQASGAAVTSLAQTCAQYRYSNFQSPTLVNPGRLSLWTLRVGAKVQF